jgi:hypothetical protein
MRLWYAPHTDHQGHASGFDFFVGNMVCGPAMQIEEQAPSDLMSHPETVVECVFHGVAFFDGVRHLCMGDEDADESGYVNYPDIEGMMLALAGVLALQQALCPLTTREGR